MNPSRTLREIAELSSNPVVKAKIEEFAVDLEAQHNRQNNLWSAALGNAELAIDNRFDTLRTEIMERISDMDARQLQMLKMLEDLQTELHALGQRPPCMHPDLARQQLEAGDDAGSG